VLYRKHNHINKYAPFSPKTSTGLIGKQNSDFFIAVKENKRKKLPPINMCPPVITPFASGNFFLHIKKHFKEITLLQIPSNIFFSIRKTSR